MPAPQVMTSDRFAELCRADGEFRVASRHWTGGLRFEGLTPPLGVAVVAGEVQSYTPEKGDPGVITLTAPAEIWADLTAAVPPRLRNDLHIMLEYRRMSRDGDPLLYYQYYPALARACELLRPTPPQPALPPPKPAGAYDAPIGRYVHLDIEGQDHRIYFEEAGTGIPILLQHTAGCHGSQWRHLMERREVTDHFRLIAYDLPFHGKSLPPVGPQWWAREYNLTASFLRAVPVGLADVLGLERPIFMGCSVGGLLALDLALHHPDRFRSVVSLEGALKIPVTKEALWALWHPQIGNDYKGRVMDSLMSPTSPQALRRETSLLYSAGWPAAFLGDIHYYSDEYDLRTDAGRIDTSRLSVHILSGEYDASGPVELGEAAHRAIPGSTFTVMKDVGHFPMSENPDVFMGYIMPILQAIRDEPPR